MKHILIVDDGHLRNQLGELLEERGYRVLKAASVKDAEKIIETKKLNFAVIDLKLDVYSDFGGIQVFNFIRKHQPKTKMIILSGWPYNDKIAAEFKEQLKEDVKYEETLKDIENNYISKGGQKNYILAVLEKLERFLK